MGSKFAPHAGGTRTSTSDSFIPDPAPPRPRPTSPPPSPTAASRRRLDSSCTFSSTVPESKKRCTHVGFV
eukprot:31396-Pelagococcus_subviridis.AAC.6